MTLADIDFASFCAFTLTDFRDGTHWAGASYGRPGRIAFADRIEANSGFHAAGIDYSMTISPCASVAARATGPAPTRTASC